MRQSIDSILKVASVYGINHAGGRKMSYTPALLTDVDDKDSTIASTITTLLTCKKKKKKSLLK